MRILRNYVKWDAQPASAVAAREALLRAAWLRCTAPMGPVYVNLDAACRRRRCTASAATANAERFVPGMTSAAFRRDLVAAAVLLLRGAGGR